MAYISLVHKKSGTVQQIQDSNEPTFETHEDFEWVNGPYDKVDDDGLQAPDFYWDTQKQQVTKRDIVEVTYDFKRKFEYEQIEEQLDKLWHDMELGLVPGKDGQWYQSVAAVKDKYPKS